jgi:SAM-dependent methyltransferase/predicted O-methyltransferase YrrM
VDPSRAEQHKDALWPERPQAATVEFNVDAQRHFVLTRLASATRVYDELLDAIAHEPGAYTEPNDYFMGLDSRVLVATLLELRPRAVIEIGSGFSTRLMAAVNHHLLESSVHITTIDPFPSDEVRTLVSGTQTLIAEPVQAVGLDRFAQLGRRDVLFIDSSHVLKTGSDVAFLLADVLPRLAAGVVVHFHDVFLPAEYPYEWVVAQRRDWNEQYAVHALLANSDRYEVLFGSRFAMQELRTELEDALGGKALGGQSIWLRVADDAAPRSPAEPLPVRALAYDPQLVPPIELMRTEGIDVLEEWFRWGEEWSVMLRVYGRLRASSRVLEIGCGLGRTAFPLRFLLSEGSYDGFEIVAQKVQFLQRFTADYPNFRFIHADLANTHYNPAGRLDPSTFRFPYGDEAFDLVYAASVFTHLLPQHATQYLREISRVLTVDGRAVVSVFLLDNFDPARRRPLGFSRSGFDLVHRYRDVDGFAVAERSDPERMTGYSLELLTDLADRAGLELAEPPVPGLWSGAHLVAVGAQDLVVLRRRTVEPGESLDAETGRTGSGLSV